LVVSHFVNGIWLFITTKGTKFTKDMCIETRGTDPAYVYTATDAI